MKKTLYAVGMILLMILSYALGRKHTAPTASEGTSARRVLYWVDPMHPNYKSDHPGIAPDCGMELEPVYADSVTSAIVAVPPSPGSVNIDLQKQQLFGIRVVAVEKTSGTQRVRLLGRVVPEDTRVYRINSGMDGFVRETYNDSVGELVKKDQKLATSYVGDTLSVASGFLAATAGVPGSVGKDGARTVPFPGAVSKQGVSSLQGYSDRLRNLGVSDAQIKQMSENRQLPESVDIVSPAEGFILARNISPGQHFERGTEFYRIADLSKVWILADIFGSEAQAFQPGAVARVTLSDQRKSFLARVSNVLPQVDPTTRTLKLRLEVDNPSIALRPDMFVDVELPVAMPAGLTVPLDAVIDTGREQRVFVESSSGVFEPRQVQAGWRFGGRVEILHGLKEGEHVVAAGTFMVDSESRLKSGQSRKEDSPDKGASPSGRGPHLAACPGKTNDRTCNVALDTVKATAQDKALN
jgi:membrane fusion protein, copper/silver efflux system